MIDVAGRSILITGGSSGIGHSCAELAASLGARVTVADVAGTGPLEDVSYLVCDAGDPSAVERAVEAANSGDGLDALVSTVGGAHPVPIEELTPERWQAELDFNLTSTYVACRVALPAIRGGAGGAIVTVSSGYANLPGPDRAGYSAAKAGVIAFSRSLAAAVAGDGVRVNCVAPGPTDTPRFREMNGAEGVERIRRSMPMGEIPEARDVANAVLFLLSGAARQITGQVLHVNGGHLMP